jgi:hypothetical protein
MEEPQQWVRVIRQDEFLKATLLRLAGPETLCSLEGHLRRYELPNVISHEDRAVDVEHIQVERQGLLAMGAYDGLDDTWVGSSVPRTELDHLVDAGTIELKNID